MTSAARSWKPYPAYKDAGVEWLGKGPEQESEATAIFQTGLTGYAGCVLSFNPVHPVIMSIINKPQINTDLITEKLYNHSSGASQKPMQPKAHTFPPKMLFVKSKNKPQINADERRLIAPEHCKGREERKAMQQKSLRPDIVNTIRRRTRMTRRIRIFTDNLIRAHQCHPCNPCSIGFTPYRKSSNNGFFPLLTQQEPA